MSDPAFRGPSDTPYERWLVRHVLRVMGLSAEEGLAVAWGAAAPAGARAAVIVPRQDDFLERPEALTAMPFDEPGRGLAVRPAAGGGGGGCATVELDLDVLSWIGWIVSRAEEYGGFLPDGHGRFFRTSALMERLGLGDLPVADLLVAHLREALLLAAATAGIAVRRSLPWPQGKRLAVCLTHDVDKAIYRSRFHAALRLPLAACALAAGKAPVARGLLDQAVGLARGGGRSPYWLFDDIAELEASFGVRSAFYLLPHRRNLVWEGHRLRRRYDCAEPRLLETIGRLAGEGWEVGLHAPYRATDTPDGIAKAWRQLGDVLGPAVEMKGGRTHYLRFSVPDTWRQAADCGMRYDATLGWPEGTGVRSGTLWPYQPFNRTANAAVGIWELGLHFMDTHRPVGESMTECVRRVLDSAERVGGCACLLFHPNTRTNQTRQEYLQDYRRVLELLAGRPEAWVATPAEVVQRLGPP